MRLSNAVPVAPRTLLNQKYKLNNDTMIVKVHKKDDRTILAVCDDSLLGQKFEEGGRQLDLTGEFYNGEKRSNKETGDLVRNADIVNLVGEESIKIGLEEGIIEESQIIRIKGIPHAQAIVVHE